MFVHHALKKSCYQDTHVYTYEGIGVAGWYPLLSGKLNLATIRVQG